MYRRLIPALLFALVLTGFALPTPGKAAGGQTTSFRFQGRAAEAVFESVSGCIVTDAFVFGGLGTMQQPGGTTQTFSFIDVGTFNQCAQQPVSFCGGTLDNPTVQADQALASAAVSGSGTLFCSDQSGTPLAPCSAAVDLSFTGTGPTASNSSSTSVFRTQAFTEVSHSTGRSRAALVAGSVTACGVSFTASDVVFSQLLNVKAMDVSISH